MALAKKTTAQLDREIAAALAERPKPKTKHRHRGHQLFYLSEDQQGGKHAEHIEQFDNLGDAIDMLAKLPHGSITYGNATEGPKFMLVWAMPASTDQLYWTDGDLSAQLSTQKETREIRRLQAPPGKRGGPFSATEYYDARFKRELASLKKSGYR